jgi:hypothetical protein
MKSTPIYRGWKRVILSLLEKNFCPWFVQKRSQSLVELATLGRCRDLYGVNQPERTTWCYRAMSGDHLRINLVEKWSIKCTWKVATRATFRLKIKEDNEQWPDDALSDIFLMQNDAV